MKSTIILVVLAVWLAGNNAAVLNSAPIRSNLVSGGVSVGDTLLHRQYVYRAAIANTIQSEDVIYRGNFNTRITAIQASEIGYTQYATAWVLSGGVGYNNATIRIQSAKGFGYYYLLDIWGR